jgi:hypothetical protein
MNQTFWGGKPCHLRKLLAQIFRQPLHDLLAVAFGLLRRHNGFADVPIQRDQPAIEGNHRAQLCRADARLEISEDRDVTDGQRGGRFAATRL